jgi:uncharacterized protein YndB with AHSA1/START domain
MKTFSASARIEATPESVWTILTDAEGYPAWDSTYTRIAGRIALGETITLHHRSIKPPVLVMKVSAFEPIRRMVWTGGGMPEVAFKGERIFTLTPLGADSVEFSTFLVFSGLMAPFIISSSTNLQPQLDEFVAALKRRAEQHDSGAEQHPSTGPTTVEPTSEAPSITIVRTFAAAAAEVFAAWTDPALLRQWLAPGPCEVIEATADARPGGQYRIVVRDPTGGRHVTSGEYQEVVPATRLVKTWVYEGGGAAVDRYPTLLTVDFRATGPNSTEITLRQDRLLTLEDREGNREGWRQCLDKLQDMLAAPA